MVTKPIETNSAEMSAEEMAEVLEIKAMLERNKDKIMQEADILAHKYKMAIATRRQRK